MSKTAAMPETPAGSVRVTWSASVMLDMRAPRGGVTLDAQGNYTSDPKGSSQKNYAATRAANYLLASEFALRHAESGIITDAWNPGNLATSLQRHWSALARCILTMRLHPARMGGYTELWAGWAPEAESRNGMVAMSGLGNGLAVLRRM